MTEPAEQTHHLETLGNPSGVDALGLLPASDLAGPERGRGGPQRDQERQQQAENCVHINPDELRQLKGGQVCPVQLHQTPDDKCNPRRTLWCDETKVLEERKTFRASRSEEMFANGLLAPHNTTQYLMDEHNQEEPDLRTQTGVRRSQGVGALMEYTSSREDLLNTEEFLHRDFSEAYEMYYRESLQSMTKQERVQEYLEPEKRMSRLEEENNSTEVSQVRLREMERLKPRSCS